MNKEQFSKKVIKYITSTFDTDGSNSDKGFKNCSNHYGYGDNYISRCLGKESRSFPIGLIEDMGFERIRIKTTIDEYKRIEADD